MYNDLSSSKTVTDDVIIALVRNNSTAQRLAVQSNKKMLADALKKLEGLMDKVRGDDDGWCCVMMMMMMMMYVCAQQRVPNILTHAHKQPHTTT